MADEYRLNALEMTIISICDCREKAQQNYSHGCTEKARAPVEIPAGSIELVFHFLLLPWIANTVQLMQGPSEKVWFFYTQVCE